MTARETTVASRAEPTTRPLGITVYGCEHDEASVFRELGPRFGVLPTLTIEPASVANVIAVPRNRCASVGHRSEVSAQVLRALREAGVEHVSTRSIGSDHIDLSAAAELGITVDNAVYAPDGVADYTVMLILMMLRDAAGILRAAARHDYSLRPKRSRDLRELTVGVVGAGRIGSAVARRLRGFGCQLLVHDRSRSVAMADRFVSLGELLAESDIVTLHLPLAPDTHHVIGREEIAAMKAGAFVVNTGRGALVDTGALVVALEHGHLGGAALDVLEGEEGIFYVDRTTLPIEHDFLHRLGRLPNVIVTPHTAFHTERALHETVTRTLRNCLDDERRRTDGGARDGDPVRRTL